MSSEYVRELQANFDRLTAEYDAAQNQEKRDAAITAAQKVLAEMVKVAKEDRESFEANLVRTREK